MHAAHMTTMLRIFEARNAALDNRKIIDLHGLHVKEGLHIVKIAMAWLNEEGVRTVRIVTGAGNHSKGKTFRCQPHAVARAG